VGQQPNGQGLTVQFSEIICVLKLTVNVHAFSRKWFRIFKDFPKPSCSSVYFLLYRRMGATDNFSEVSWVV
jgi:hypothetical protein